MEEEKQMEEMVESMKKARKECGESSCAGCDCVKYGAFCQFAKYAKVAILKADEVRKETEKRIYQKLYDLCTKDNPFGAYDLLKEDVLGWAKEDGVEIEECKTVDFEDIEQSDVIELPCKMQIPHVKGVDVFMYQVLWRSNDGSGFVSQRFFNTEPEADAFLAELKGGKK